MNPKHFEKFLSQLPPKFQDEKVSLSINATVPIENIFAKLWANQPNFRFKSLQINRDMPSTTKIRFPYSIFA